MGARSFKRNTTFAILIWVTCSFFSHQQATAFFVSSAEAPQVVDPAQQGLMGCGLDEVQVSGQTNVIIKSVIPGFAAYHAGVQVGDLVQSLDGNKVTSAKALSDAIKQKKPGEIAVLDLIRKEKNLQVKVRVSSRKDFEDKGPEKYVGKVAPELFVLDRKGKSVNLADRKAKKPVVVMLWATWCPACKQTLPLFQQLKKKHTGKLDFVLVSNENFETIDLFQKSHLEFDALLKEALQSDESKLHIAYWAEALPTFVFISADSKLEASQVGFNSDSFQENVGKLLK